jgi:hypothetical protein
MRALLLTRPPKLRVMLLPPLAMQPLLLATLLPMQLLLQKAPHLQKRLLLNNL